VIVDDYWPGLRRLFGSPKVAPRVIEVPFRVGIEEVVLSGEEVGVRLITNREAVIRPFLPTTRDSMMPGEEFDPDTFTFDLEFARPPFPQLVLIDEQREGLVAFQVAEAEGRESWTAAAVRRVGDYLFPIPGLAWRDGLRLRYHINLGDTRGAERLVERYVKVQRWMLRALNPAMSERGAENILGSLYPGRHGDTGRPRTVEEVAADVEEKTGYVLTGCVAAFALLNCRNVVQVEQAPCRAARRRAERAKLPAFSYHVLRVGPVRQAREPRAGARPEPLGHVALHWTRGHFKTFSAARPLFGRIVGRWWWQPHLAGRNRRRFVDKDYRLEGPQPAAPGPLGSAEKGGRPLTAANPVPSGSRAGG
jgi:hypothetical protein